MRELKALTADEKPMVGDMNTGTLFVFGELTTEVIQPQSAVGSFAFERLHNEALKPKRDKK